VRPSCLPAACAVFCLLAVSCASERLVASSGPTPPWVRQTPEPAADRLLVTGQSVGVNVLQEALMRERAMEDARRQVASMIGTTVQARSHELLEKAGYAPGGSDEVRRALYRREIQTAVDQVVRAVREEAFYWEKWRVRPGLLAPAFVRYKYFVLASYPTAEYDRTVGYLARALADRERAASLIDRGRPIEAAEVLERLLDRHPDSPTSVRLMLAEAYERAQMLEDARRVLRTALDLAGDQADRARIRERLERLREAFPDLRGTAAYIVLDLSEMRPYDVSTATVEEPFAAARVRVLGVHSVRCEWATEGAVAAAGRQGADWLFELKLSLPPSEPLARVYDVQLHQARVECDVRALSVSTGQLLDSRSASERGLGRDRREAVERAAAFALRAAVRRSLVSLAARRADDGSVEHGAG